MEGSITWFWLKNQFVDQIMEKCKASLRNLCLGCTVEACYIVSALNGNFLIKISKVFFSFYLDFFYIRGDQVLTPHSYPHHYFANQFTVLSFTSMHISYISQAQYTTLSHGEEHIKGKTNISSRGHHQPDITVISIAALL